jgi:peptide deformylase
VAQQRIVKLQIRKYGDPVLRHKGARIEKVSAEIKKLVTDMFDTMYEARGVGLAAQQVGHALQLTIVDVRGIKDRPSTMEIGGKPVDVEAHMPLVLINPELILGSQTFTGPEGCLSFPEMFAEITRPAEVDVVAMNDKGEKISFHAGGLLAKAVQHEFDHLQGILFIDRMSSETKRDLKPELDALAEEIKAELRKKR